MKKNLTLFHFVFFISYYSFSQNVGIGTNQPSNKLEVIGSLLVNIPTITTNTPPTAAQTKTLQNGSNLAFTDTDSTGRIYDPGGPGGNYLPNLAAAANIPFLASNLNSGFEITAETMNLGTGDSLIIKESASGNILLAVGNGYTTTGKWRFNFPTLLFIFKSNGDASTGAGFSLLFRRIYDNSASLPDVSGYAGGKGLFFDAKKAALRSGFISNAEIGLYSTALGSFANATGASSIAVGEQATASGEASFAAVSGTASGDHAAVIGSGTASGNFSSSISGGTASESYAVALGLLSNATGNGSIAIGLQAGASGVNSIGIGQGSSASDTLSIAMGSGAHASGYSATAVGTQTFASGDYSSAMGRNANTNGHTNSFCIGGTGAATSCTANNQFMTRFDNYTFWISASNYAYLIPSSNGWAYTSDKNKKEKFEELDGETVLKKISGISFSSWNFKAADTRQYRHYGIMAQDFYNAFGKDRYGTIGNDTTVSPLDLLGVAYSAIKALEKRTGIQQQQNDKIVNENRRLREDNLVLQKRLNMLEAKLNDLIALKEKEALMKAVVVSGKQ